MTTAAPPAAAARRRAVGVIAYLRLCRADAPAIALLSYLVGVRLAGASLEPLHLVLATLLAAVSTNFIYTVNAVTDWREDLLSHPGRPIPAGDVSLGDARRWALVLLAASFAYPPLLLDDARLVAGFWLLPVLGSVYSVPPLRLRRFPPVGALVISVGLVTPMCLGYLGSGGGPEHVPLLAELLLFCLAVVPLKAIDEAAGDAVAGDPNLWARFGRRLLWWPATVLAVVAVLGTITLGGRPRMFLVAAALTALAAVGRAAGSARPAGTYQLIINAVILEGAVYFGALLLL